MDVFQILIVGFFVAFNGLIIKIKIEKKRYADAVIDASTLVGLSILFAGSLGGLQVATVASAIISISLWFFPPKTLFTRNQVKQFKEKYTPKKKLKL